MHAVLATISATQGWPAPLAVVACPLLTTAGRRGAQGLFVSAQRAGGR